MLKAESLTESEAALLLVWQRLKEAEQRERETVEQAQFLERDNLNLLLELRGKQPAGL